MAVEFIGYTNVQHARQPDGTEQCYAAIVSAVSGAQIHEAQASLYHNGLVQDDGSVGLIPATVQLEVPGTSAVIEIEPLETPEDPEEVMQLMDRQFAAGRAVAFLHRKPWDPEKNPEDSQEDPEESQSIDYHWVLFTGYLEIDGEKSRVHTIDPLQEEAEYLRRSTIVNIIRRSNDYENGASGVFLQAISNSLGSSPEPGKQ